MFAVSTLSVILPAFSHAQNAAELLPDETVLCLSSPSLGSAFANVIQIVEESGFVPSHGLPSVYGFNVPQKGLTTYDDDFGFSSEFWNAAQVTDGLLQDSNMAIGNKLQHLFPGSGFIALVAERGKLVTVFGIQCKNGFDWFAEFSTTGKSEHRDAISKAGIDIFHNLDSGLFFFQKDNIVYGAYSLEQVERLAVSVSGKHAGDTLKKNRLFVRVNKPFDSLSENNWDLELFVNQAGFFGQMESTIESLFGKPTELFRKEGERWVPNSQAFADPNYIFGAGSSRKSIDELGVAVKFRFSNLTESTKCQFGLVRAVAVPLAKSYSFLDALTPISRAALSNEIEIPSGTDFLWIADESALDTILSGKGIRSLDSSLLLTPLLVGQLIPADSVVGNKSDRGQMNIVFGGGVGKISYKWDFVGRLSNATRREESPQSSADSKSSSPLLIETDVGGTSVKTFEHGSDHSLVHFYAFGSRYTIWQNKRNGLSPAIEQMLNSSDRRSTVFDIDRLRKMFDEDSKINWSMAEATDRNFPGLGYFFPSVRDSDILLRPEPALAARVDKKSSGELYKFDPSVFSDLRAANKDEFPGTENRDFFSDFWFRVRFQLVQHDRFNARHSSESFVTYLLHNTDRGNGIWLVKGQIFKSNPAWRAYKKKNAENREMKGDVP